MVQRTPDGRVCSFSSFVSPGSPFRQIGFDFHNLPPSDFILNSSLLCTRAWQTLVICDILWQGIHHSDYFFLFRIFKKSFFVFSTQVGHQNLANSGQCYLVAGEITSSSTHYSTQYIFCIGWSQNCKGHFFAF